MVSVNGLFFNAITLLAIRGKALLSLPRYPPTFTCIQLQSRRKLWNLNQKLEIQLQCSDTSKITSSALKRRKKRKQNDLRSTIEDSCGIGGDVYSWNSKIKKLTQSGRVEDARQVFDKIPQRDILSWNLMITGYAQNERLENARQIFDEMPERNVVSWNAMIAGYAQNGKMEHARHLFDRMPERNVVSWNTMITGYAQNERMEDARQMFDKMPRRDTVSWNSIIAGYAQNGKVENARQLFDKMLERNVVSWNAMIAGYVQNGRIEDARLLFDKMPERNVISWNIMIAGYVKNHRLDDAHRLFDRMTVRNVISWTPLITGYAQNGRLEDARQLFDKMPNRNVVSWNAMIMGYIQGGKIDDARELFDRMHETDVVSWNAMITAYSQIRRVEEARHLFDRMPQPDVVSWNAMIAGYAQNERIEDALQLFNKMPKRDVISWNVMIAGYEQNGHCEEALYLFSQMQWAGVKPDHTTFTSILSACGSLAALEQGKQVQGYITKIGIVADIPMGNSLITMYSKCGSLEDARLVFNEMPSRDVVSWNAIITGYAQHGCAEEGLQLFKHMQQAGMKPNHVTFVGVLSACSHAGLVEEGWCWFESMGQDYLITPSTEHYAAMVDLLGRSGHLDDAEDFIRRMPFEPDAVVWGALLGACRVHGNVDIGQRAADSLFELEPQNSGTYVLLSNIYAAASRWDDVLKVRKMMKDRGIRKQPGCSWIELKNRVHAFVVGDRSHPQTESIYAILERLAEQIKNAGYVANTNFVLHDVEEEQKEQAISYHSEKLAIAFGLLNTPPRSPIRIIKNLRVCGDCHTAIRFISKIVGREIALRDANRFHHFKEGLCSCGNYW
eukprot:Gb_12722 [translate_table: standard]